MKLTLTRGFETQGRAPSFRSAVKKRGDLKFESNKLAANHLCCVAPHQHTHRARSRIRIETPVRSVNRNRHERILFSACRSANIEPCFGDLVTDADR